MAIDKLADQIAFADSIAAQFKALRNERRLHEFITLLDPAAIFPGGVPIVVRR